MRQQRTLYNARALSDLVAAFRVHDLVVFFVGPVEEDGKFGARDGWGSGENYEYSGVINDFGNELEDVDGDKLVSQFVSC